VDRKESGDHFRIGLIVNTNIADLLLNVGTFFIIKY